MSGSHQISHYASLVKSCSSLEEVKQTHLLIRNSEHSKNIYIANLLLEMYGKRGGLAEARELFDSLESPNLFSWNILITAFAQNGHLQEARNKFDSMPFRDIVSWTAVLRAYAERGNLEQAVEIFENMPDRNIISWNIMLTAHQRYSLLDDLMDVYNCMPGWSLVSWNTLLQECGKSNVPLTRTLFYGMPCHDRLSWKTFVHALVQNGEFLDAREAFMEMPETDVVAWNLYITAVARMGHLEQARFLFDTMPERDVFSWTALIVGYGCYGRVSEAREIFDAMPEADLTAWTSMTEAYARNGCTEDAREMFSRMPEQDIVSCTAVLTGFSASRNVGEAEAVFLAMPEHDTVSFTAMVTTYAQGGDLAKAQRLHDIIPEPNVVSSTALLAAYAHLGDLDQTKRFFGGMRLWNSVSWSVLIAACAENGKPREGIHLFRTMNQEGYHPDESAFSSAFYSCSLAGSLGLARSVHSIFTSTGYETSVFLTGVLISMYGRCGDLQTAEGIFSQYVARCNQSPLPWCTMVAVYSENGKGTEAMVTFWNMFVLGQCPTDLAFVTILSSCSHRGMLEEGLYYFRSMVSDCGIVPGINHYHCVIDLLGRSGRVDEAQEMLKNMPFRATSVAWYTLLSACKVHGDTRLGQAAAIHGSSLNPLSSAPYLLLSNSYMLT